MTQLSIPSALDWIIRRVDRVEHKLNRALENQEKIMATQDQVLELARQAKTVSESNNIALREAIRLLKQGQSDPAKNDEAAALLQAIIDDDSIVTDNTPAAGEST